MSRTIQDHSANPSPVPPKEKEETPRRSYDLTPSSSNMSLSATSSTNKVAEAAETTSKTESLRRKFYFPPVSSPNFQIGNVNIVVLKQVTHFACSYLHVILCHDLYFRGLCIKLSWLNMGKNIEKIGALHIWFLPTHFFCSLKRRRCLLQCNLELQTANLTIVWT